MKEVLRAIDRGETVNVLYRGKGKAKLTPVTAESGKTGKPRPRFEDSPLFGMWRDRKDMADPVAYVRKLRQSRLTRNGTSTKRK